MPGFRHGVTVKMFRNSGELARELAGLVADLPSTKLVASAVANDLSEALPVEYRADQVMAYRRQGRETPELAIIVEVQHKKDLRKKWTWMSYVANAAADHECRVMLLVVTWSAHVAKWARGPFTSGHPGFELSPLVIDLSKLPKLLSKKEGSLRIPELAVLCALANGDAPSANVALKMLRGLPSDRAQLYWTAIAKALSPSDLHIMEKKMENLAADAKMFLRKLPRLTSMIGEPFEARGLKKGRVEGLKEAAIQMLKVKLGKVSSAQEAAVRAMQDARSLLALIAKLGAVDKAKEIRAALAHASQQTRATPRGRSRGAGRRAA
jgi:hypothetical protein